MNKISFSKVKLEEKILNGLNSMLRKDISDSRVKFVSVTRVELNNDFSIAKVYWDTFDSSTRGDAKKAVSGMSGKLRSRLSQSLNIRHTPSLEFFYDSQFEDELKITELLKNES